MAEPRAKQRHSAGSPLAATGRWARREALALVELAGLSALGLSQPVLGPFGESPETFSALDASAAEIVRFGLVVAFGPLVVLGLLGALAGLAGKRVRSAVHLLLLGALGAASAMTIVRGWELGAGLRVLIALLSGAVLVLAYQRLAPVATFLRFGSVAPVVLLGVFLFSAPVSDLVHSGSTQATVPGGQGPDTPVLMIVFDELPALSLMDGSGDVDEELLPNFSRLADASTWYRNATTVSPHTRVAVPSMLTGVLPTEVSDGWDPNGGEQHHSLFGLLGASHRVHASEWVTAVCSEDVCERPDPYAEEAPEAAALLPGAIEEGRSTSGVLADEALQLLWHSAWPLAEPLELQYQAVGVDGVAELAIPAVQFISSMEQSDEPVLDYFHALVPHQPWVLLPSGLHYPEPEDHFGLGAEDLGLGLPAPVWRDGPADRAWVSASQHRHLLQLQWADRMLGAFMDRMQRLGRWHEAVVVVTSDHGISFEPGDELRLLRPHTQVPVAWVPLFIKAPGQRNAEISDRPVSLIDVLPTVADYLGLEIPWETDGVSLVGEGPDSERERWAVVEEQHLFNTAGEGDRILLDADGLGALNSAGPYGIPGDALRLWRYGPHGDLLGTEVDGALCQDSLRGEVTALDVPQKWDDGVEPDADGTLGVWVQGSVSGGAEAVALVMDGVVVGTSPVAGPEDGPAVGAFGMLVAEPLILGAEGPFHLLAIVEDEDCFAALQP